MDGKKRKQAMHNTIMYSVARKHAEEHSIIFEEDLDSEGELTVVSALRVSNYQADFDFDEDRFGI